MSVLAIISTELLKLKRSRVVLVAIGAPSLAVLGLHVLMLGSRRPVPWDAFCAFALNLWAFFLLPLAITLLSVLTAQIEHGAKTWNYVLTAPVARWRIFAVKVALVLVLAGLMSLALYLLLPLSGEVRKLSRPAMPGTYDWERTGRQLAGVYCAALPLIAVQLWSAFRFRNMAVPLAVGVGGGFVAVISVVGSQFVGETRSIMRFFPWLMPVETLRPEPWLAEMVWYGLYGGIALLLMAVVHLARREVT